MDGPVEIRAPAAARRAPGLTLMLALVALALLASTVRLAGQFGPDGLLDKDEAKLALTADGVLRTGLPMMPSGRIYTRGVLNSYLVAGSFAAFGQHDFAARLPSILAGALLVPCVFLLGHALGGSVAGLGAAGFVALAGPLVDWSSSAWLPSIHLLLFTLTTYCWYRGFVEQRARWQVAGGLCLWLALLSYEFAILLLGGLWVFLGWRLVRGDLTWYRGRTTALALALQVGGLALFGGLALALRTGTLAGSLAEVKSYFSPGLGLTVAGVYARALLSDYWLLIGVGLAALPLLLRTGSRAGAIYLGGLLALAFLVPSFVIQSKYEVRYMLPALPLLAILGAGGAARLAQLVMVRIPASAALRTAVTSLVVLATLGVVLRDDLPAAAGRLQQSRPGPTWLQTLEEQGLRPTDLLVTEGPERARFYLGRVDFHIYAWREFRDSDNDSDRYSYEAGDAVRSIYTNSVLLNQRGDFERLVEQPNHGRTVWIIGSEAQLRRQAERMDPDLWPSLVRSAGRRIETGDGWILLKCTLPLRHRHA